MKNPLSRIAVPDAPETSAAQPTYVKITPAAMNDLFAAPKWLQDVGLTAWFAVGAMLLLLAFVWLLTLTSTIVIPLILAGVIAAVAAPVVAWFQSHGIPRGIGTLIFLLILIAFGGLIVYAIFAGVVSNSGDAGSQLKHAASEITNWLKAHGIDPKTADQANANVSSSTTKSASTLLDGVAKGIQGLTSFVFFLAMTLLSLVFLLKDGPQIKTWGERRMGLPIEVAQVITNRVIQSLRGYFFGVTIIATFNALVVGIGALLLGVPLVATIAVVTFVGAYIPFLGAWAAGAFSVLIALGSGSQEAVIGMIIIQLLANGILQQLVQPIAYGAALGIHPLAALVATIGGGCLFGAVGLILGAPLVSATVRISSDLANAKEAEKAAAPATGESPPGGPEPAPA